MLNKAELIGRLGRDPETKTLGNGDKVCNLSIATEETWRDKGSGEKRSKTEWHRVTLWRGLADVADRYLKKGDLVYICGKIETRKWQDQSGQDRYSTEIICSGFKAEMKMLSSRGSDEGGSGGDGPKYGDHRSGSYTPPAADDLSDEIPF